MNHENYGDDLLYVAAPFAVVTLEGSEDDYFAAVAPTPPDLPI